MENYKLHAMNFIQTLQACNEQQRKMFLEIMEGLHTYIEEILLSRHLSVGATDTVNVQELLYRDFLELVSHLKIGREEQIYFDKLKTLKENLLRCLLKMIPIFRSKTEITAEQLTSMKMKEQERADLTGFLSLVTNILQDVIAAEPGDQTLFSILGKIGNHRMTFNYQNEVFEVDEINKRNLGKMIIRLVGHEGTDTKPGLRRLLQACIDFLQTEGAGVWKNASITIYDEDDDMYKIVSGTRKHQFICRMKNGEPFIKEKSGAHPHKKPKAYHQQQPAQSETHEKSCILM